MESSINRRNPDCDGRPQSLKPVAKRFRAKMPGDNGISLSRKFQCLGHQSCSKNIWPAAHKVPNSTDARDALSP